MRCSYLSSHIYVEKTNSAALTTTTNRRPKGVSDGTDIQIGTQMINKCRIKMTQKELYNVRDLPREGDRKIERKKYYSN